MNIPTILKSLFFVTFPVVFNLHAGLITIASESKFNDLLRENKQIVLKFSADCLPHHQITKQLFVEVSKEKEFSNIGFINLNVKSSVGYTLASQFKISDIPALIFIQDRKVIECINGLEYSERFKYDLQLKIKTVLMGATDKDFYGDLINSLRKYGKKKK